MISIKGKDILGKKWRSYNFIKKETLPRFFEISKNTFLKEHLWATASAWYVVFYVSFSGLNLDSF